MKMNKHLRATIIVAARGDLWRTVRDLTHSWLSRVLIATLSVALSTAFLARPSVAPMTGEFLSVESIVPGGSTSGGGNVKRNRQDGLPYVWVPAGSFMMGCSTDDPECFSEEKPAHRVRISKGFWIGQTEVTVDAYERFAGIAEEWAKAAPNDSLSTSTQENGRAMPVVNVTWDEARDFCKWAGGRLPTEAEWEYAARGGDSASRYGELNEIAWYEKNSGNTIHRVAQKRPNQFGLFDMLGNAWEWVNDWYDGSYYARSPELDPAGPETGQMHVLRGGSWLNSPKLVRVSDRGRSNADLRFNYFGLRCVLAADGR
jgi:formylglycine-generating enzyme required for sulfatase activity